MSETPISPLRRRMIEDMTVRNFVEKTHNDYNRQLQIEREEQKRQQQIEQARIDRLLDDVNRRPRLTPLPLGTSIA
jgi:hypothetical protein